MKRNPMMLKNKPLKGCKLKFAVAGFRRQNIGRIGDVLKFQIKCKFRDGTDSSMDIILYLLTAIKVNHKSLSQINKITLL